MEKSWPVPGMGGLVSLVSTGVAGVATDGTVVCKSLSVTTKGMSELPGNGWAIIPESGT